MAQMDQFLEKREAEMLVQTPIVLILRNPMVRKIHVVVGLQLPPGAVEIRVREHLQYHGWVMGIWHEGVFQQRSGLRLDSPVHAFRLLA